MATTSTVSEPASDAVMVDLAPNRHERIVVAILIGGAAVAVLVGTDGAPGWQAIRVAGVAIVTLAVARAVREGGRWGRPLAAGFGVLIVAIGLGFTPYLVKETASLEAIAGGIAVVTGIVLVTAGTVVGTRGRGRISRIGAGVGALVTVVVVAFVVGPAVAATNMPRAEIGATPASRGLPYESVTLATRDGVQLAGWYVPSENRAAVVLLPGAGSTRSNVLDEAVVLARHGFGVLLLDARGQGESAGRAMGFGWHGDADIDAATTFLAARGDVDRDRIGAVGMSMGGEEAIGATANDPLIRAVVAEGATARNAGDEDWLSDQFGIRGLLQEQLEGAQDLVTDVLTSASVPRTMRAAVEATDATRYLLITGGDVADEAHAAAYITAGAPDRVQTWTVPGAEHTGGLVSDPNGWERRVVGFLDEVLLAGGSSPRV